MPPSQQQFELFTHELNSGSQNWWCFLYVLQVLKQLPAKEEKVEYCSMSEKQQVLYDKLLKKLKSSTTGESESDLDDNFLLCIRFSVSHV